MFRGASVSQKIQGIFFRGRLKVFQGSNIGGNPLPVLLFDNFKAFPYGFNQLTGRGKNHNILRNFRELFFQELVRAYQDRTILSYQMLTCSEKHFTLGGRSE